MSHTGSNTGSRSGNRLDKHVGKIRNKLTLERFLAALGYSIALFFVVVLIHTLVDRFFWVSLPKAMVWFWSAATAAVLGALVFAMLRRPSVHSVAVFIDGKLGLNEKFSTAMFARQQAAAEGRSLDPFMAAALLDAERTADNVSLHRRFPIQYPKSGFITLGMALLVLLVSWLLPRIDLFDRHKKAEALAHKPLSEREEAQRNAEHVMAMVSSQSAGIKDMPKVELAQKDELSKLLSDPKADAKSISQTAQKLQEEADAAAKQEELKKNQAYAESQAQNAVFSSLNPSADDKGPVATASRDIANDNFADAMKAIQSLPTQFNALNPQEQQKQIEDMKKVAAQLANLANDKSAMNNIEKQLKQQGINPDQVQKAIETARAAAQGDPEAAKKLQQMQKDLTQQMNNGQGPTPQQQQAISQAIQKMQSVANTQAKAQQMTAGAQGMVQGMQQAQSARQGGTQAGQQQANAKMGNAQAAGSKPGGQQASGKQGAGQQAAGGQQAGQQPGGQQAGGQQAGGQQAGAQQAGGAQASGQQQGSQPAGQQSGSQQANGAQPGGNQPGGKQGGGQGSGQQQMKQASDQMAQALGQMDAVQKDAEEVAAMQRAAGQPDDGGGNNPGDGKGGNGKGGGGQAPGKLGKVGNEKGNGMGGPGIGAGGKGEKEVAQFTVKQEIDPSQNINGGKVLAKTFVKAPQLKGNATVELSPDARASAVKNGTDDVSEASIPKDAQKVVKDYFDGN